MTRYMRLGADGQYHVYDHHKGCWWSRLYGARKWRKSSPGAQRELDSLTTNRGPGTSVPPAPLAPSAKTRIAEGTETS